MTLEGEYEPSPQKWVRDQVEAYERSGGTEANTLLDTGMPIIIVTNRGNRSGKIRKTPLMRVEHDGEYALVASQGGGLAYSARCWTSARRHCDGTMMAVPRLRGVHSRFSTTACCRKMAFVSER